MYIIKEYNTFKEESHQLAGIALIVDNKKICLVLPKKFKGDEKYSIPKGHVEEDKSLFHNAYLEMREETGIDIGLRQVDSSFKYTYKKNGIKKNLHVFIIKVTKEEYEDLEKGKRDKKEIRKVKLCKRKKALDLVEPHFKKLIRYLFK